MTTTLTLADVLDAIANSEVTYEAIADAVAADALAFTQSAITTYRAVSEKITTAKDIADGCKAAGRGYASTPMVCAHARTGEVLSFPGELPEGVGPRDVQAFYTAKKVIRANGVSATMSVAVTASQHAGIVALATDIDDAVKRLRKAVRENIAARTEKMAASQDAQREADAETEATDGPTDGPTVSDYLSAASLALRTALAAGEDAWTDTDRATLAAIRDMVA
jgi:hypothetical protein